MASGVVVVLQARVVRRICTSMDLAHRRLISRFHLFIFYTAEACIPSALMYACATFCVFLLSYFLGVSLHFKVTGACPVTTDLSITMRVNVRTASTKTTTAMVCTGMARHVRCLTTESILFLRGVHELLHL